MRRLLQLLVAIGLLVGACGSVEPAETTNPASTTAPSSVTSAATPTTVPTTSSPTDGAPSYEPAACRFGIPSGVDVECGYLTVPEDRSRPERRRIRLHVAVFKSSSSNPEPDPVIYLMGGAGGDALDAAGYYLQTVGNRILESRDFIMYSQRGTRYSEPFLECPGEVAFRKELDAQDLSQQEENERNEAFLRDCRDRLLDRDVDLTMYNSVTGADDVNDLRIVLGYDQVNYYGTSYGTRLGLTVMRYHPEGVRSVILDSVFPPQIDYPSDVIPSLVHAVDRIFEACAADSSCNSEYPNLESVFYQVVDGLKAEPGAIGTDGRDVVVDDHMFLDAVYLALHPASTLPDIPAAIDKAAEGDFSLLKWAIESIESYSEGVATGVYYSSVCRDEVEFDSKEHVQATLADYPPQYADYYDLSSFFSTCEWWGAGEADPIENEAVVADTPSLIFAGHFDPITSPEWGQLAAATLSSSWYFEFPNMGHGVMRADACALDIGLQFLEDPSSEPDSLCIESLPRLRFR